MKSRTIGRLAWSLAAASMSIMAAGIGLSVWSAAGSGGIRQLLTHQSLVPVSTVIYAVIGALVAARRPRNPIGWIFGAVGLLYGLNSLSVGLRLASAGWPGPAAHAVSQAAGWLDTWLWIPGTLLPPTFVFLLFPDGRLPSPRWRLVAWSTGLGLAAMMAGVALHPGPLPAWGITQANPYGLPSAAVLLDGAINLGSGLFTAGLIGSLAAHGLRFRRSAGAEREQLKWLAYAGALLAAGFAASTLLWVVWPESPAAREASIIITSLVVLGIAAAAGLAILRYRLYDINLIINRTLVYGALTASVAGLYVLVVGGAGLLFQASGNLAVSLLATGLAALVFQPLRERLQRGANRLMYGERDDPYTVLARLGRRLESSLTPEAVLPAIVETLAQTLKLPYVGIALEQAGTYAPAAQYGLRGAETIEIPLVHQAVSAGQLILSPRSAGEPFSPSEERLLKDIAQQISVAAHAVRLTNELRRTAADLQRSRERLIAAREEERRRLRRDLHDVLGPTLAAQTLKVGAARSMLERQPAAADRLLAELEASIDDALTDIRRLVYDLRPPELDELGLAGAIRESAARYGLGSGAAGEPATGGAPQIRVEAPSRLPPLPAAAEVAAYRIAQEALTNVVRHARAQTCHVRLDLDKRLHLTISDDGVGLPPERRAGLGLSSMRERAEELGGSFVIECTAGGGTRVVVDLPLQEAA